MSGKRTDAYCFEVPDRGSLATCGVCEVTPQRNTPIRRRVVRQNVDIAHLVGGFSMIGVTRDRRCYPASCLGLPV
jgi:hypothetical protein